MTTTWDYKGIFPEEAEANDKCFWGFRGIKSYAGNPLPAGVLDATATEITTPGNTKITVYAINTVAYQWQKSADGITWENMEGETKQEISQIYPYAASSAGVYYFRCLCIGWLGIVPTDKIKITVTNHPPSAYIYPPSAAVITPGSVEFTSDTEYAESKQWKHSRDGINWEDIAGATAETLTKPFIYGEGGIHQVKLSVQGLGGTAESNISRITVTDPEPIVSISADLPEPIFIGDLIVFTATAQYAEIFEWQRFVGGAWMKIPGETGKTYSHLCELGGVYSIRCIATGHGGTTISNVIPLDVKFPAPTAVIIADKSELIIGDTATITAETTWKQQISWQHSTDRTSWEYLPGETDDELHVTPGTGGQHYYRAEVLGMDGSTITSNVLQLTVYTPPTISITADKTEITTEESVALEAVAADYDNLQWQQFIDGAWANIPDATETVYTFRPEAAGEYLFRCAATGRGGTTESNVITITVTEPEPEPEP